MSHHDIETITLKAADGHVLDAALVRPTGKPRGGIVVIQEIFGLTRHIRDVAHQYADAGYLAVAPALFDRVQKNADVPYADVPAGLALMQKLKPEQTLLDMKAAIDAVAIAGKVGMVGYCWGGAVTWLAAARIPGLAAAVPYYGGAIPSLNKDRPKCPTMLHFGETDASIPINQARAVAKSHPDVTTHFYAAGHGFNCDQRASYNADAAKLARERTLAFFRKHVG
jgi:carboxymethylenebutenolidase